MKIIFTTLLSISTFIACKSSPNSTNTRDSTQLKENNNIVSQKDSGLTYLIQVPSIKADKFPIIILMHGFGSNEQDLFELKSVFPENFIVVSPRAPITLQDGAYEWYSNRDSAGVQIPNGEELSISETKVLDLIHNLENKYPIDTTKIYLGGFSQGANMSYALGLTDPNEIHGISIFSGKILSPVFKNIQKTVKLKDLKIFVGHGNADDRIPYEQAVKSVDYLKSKGIKVDFHTYNEMHHQISEQELKDFQNWLKTN
ncbi:alpha/beta hydrolase [Rhizosphaericola mali]|nr:prolyl oligopeptidase family serine peptidase [Rhizosphaericola mali]